MLIKHIIWPDKGNEMTKIVCEKDIHIYLYVFITPTNLSSYTGKGKDQLVDFYWHHEREHTWNCHLQSHGVVTSLPIRNELLIVDY